MESLRIDLFQDEVYVFTPKGEVKSLPAGSTPVDFAYAIHTDVGHRCVGAKVNGRIVPLTYRLQSGDIVEVLTSKTAQGPSRDWLNFVKSSSARNKIRQWFKRVRREDSEHAGKETLLDLFRKQGLPAQKLMRADALTEVMKEMNFAKREDFFVSVGTGKTNPNHVLTRMMQKLDKGIAEVKTDLVKIPERESGHMPTAGDLGIQVDGVGDVAIRIPQCCRPVPGDEVVGYISLGKGITVHRRDCPNVRALEKNPERFTPVHWDVRAAGPFRVEIQIEAHDRQHLLEDISRTLSEGGVNILAASRPDHGREHSEGPFRVRGAEDRVSGLGAAAHPPHRHGVRRLPRHPPLDGTRVIATRFREQRGPLVQWAGVSRRIGRIDSS